MTTKLIDPDDFARDIDDVGIGSSVALLRVMVMFVVVVRLSGGDETGRCRQQQGRDELHDSERVEVVKATKERCVFQGLWCRVLVFVVRPSSVSAVS